MRIINWLLVLLMLCLPYDSKSYDGSAIIYINWTLVGEASWTTPSFFYSVTRVTSYEDGYYYFYMWFTSNSYVWDYYSGTGQLRYVQMEDCKVSSDGYLLNYGHPVSFTFIKNYNPSMLSWKTKNPNPIIKLYWNNYYML